MLSTSGVIGLQTGYMTGYEEFAFDETGELSITHKIVTIFMIGTGVFRLFTPGDFREFFFRMAILYKYDRLLENFFGEDYLFEVTAGDQTVIIALDDIILYIGAFAGTPTKPIPFEKWLGDLDNRLRNCTISSIFSGISLFSGELAESSEQCDEPNENETLKYTPRKPQPIEKDIRNAQLLADRLVKEIPIDVFENWNRIFPAALGSFDKEANRTPEYHFDYDSLDESVKAKLVEHFTPYFEEGYYEEDMARELTYLAWLWANGLVYLTDFQGYDMYVIDRLYSFDYDLIELEDGGFNIEETKQLFNLEDIFSLLLFNNTDG